MANVVPDIYWVIVPIVPEGHLVEPTGIIEFPSQGAGKSGGEIRLSTMTLPIVAGWLICQCIRS